MAASTKQPLVFYDIPSTLPGRAFSPNTFKARYCLNYKNVPYKTVWVEYPDIAALCKKLGAEPTIWSGGSIYTLPVIYDPNTGRAVSESLDIAVYLDEHFPNPDRRLIPEGTIGLHWAFAAAFTARLDHLWKFGLSRTLEILNPASQPYFRITREAFLGGKMEDVVPKGEEREKEWKALGESFGVVESWLKKQEDLGGQGPYIVGPKPSFADFTIASFVLVIRLAWGEESGEWQKVKSWQGGRWVKLVNDFKAYEVMS